MAGWDETIGSHAVWGSLDAAQGALDEINVPGDPADLTALERLKAVVSHARSVLDNADPQLISLNSLTAIQGGLTQLLDQLSKPPPGGDGEGAGAEEDAVDLQNLTRTVASEILDACAAVAAAQPFEPQGITDSAKSYRDSVNQLLAETSTKVSEVRDALVTTTNDIQKARDAFKAEVAGAQQALATQITTLTEAKDVIATEVQEQKTRLDTMINKEAESFGSRQNERQTAFSTFIDEKTTEFEKKAAAVIERAETQLATQDAKATEALAEMNRHKTESGRLAQLIARASTAGGFQEYADDQKKLGNRWAIATIVLLLAIAVAAVAFLNEAEGTLDARRAAYALSLAAAATYAGKQAAHHRKNERKSRQFELETTAIGPYIEGLDPNNQEAIQAYMALQTFGHFDESELDTSWTPESLQKVLDTLKAFWRKPKEPPDAT